MSERTCAKSRIANIFWTAHYEYSEFHRRLVGRRFAKRKRNAAQLTGENR
jgi:hypothetical protein